jgi:Transposase IS4
MWNGRRAKTICEITEQEFWVWWGIVIAARIEGRTGTMCDRAGPEGYGEKVDMGKYMLEHRFKNIREFIPYLYADASGKENDPWWQFSKAVDDYNKNCSKTVLASFLKLMDESMSAYHPQTTKTGNLDHLSIVARKPENLGTQFKVIDDSATTMCLYLEIQQGKKGMSDAAFTDELQATSACCV